MGEKWVTEHQSSNLALTTRVSEILYEGKSEFQTIQVVNSEEFGRMLILDGVFQTSIKEEFVYHEMIAHVPLFLHPNPKRVLIIGGGDGGAAREVVRHSSIENVTMVEIDGQVVELSKKYLPEIAQAMIEKNPKLTVKIGDGIGYMKEADDYYDVIIVDCSDPIGPGEGLFTYDFYKDTFKALKKDGIFVQQTESPWMHEPIIRKSWKAVADIFPISRLYLAHIPIYPSGMHSFMMGSKQYDPLKWAGNRQREFRTRYYNEGLQRSAFVLPNFVKTLLDIECK